MSQPCSHSERMNGQQRVMTFSTVLCSAVITPKREFSTVTMRMTKKEDLQLLGVYMLCIVED